MPVVFTFNTVTELLCLLLAVVCLRKEHNPYWKSMIVYLLVVCVAEMLGVYIRKHHHPNSWVYNIILIFEAGFISAMFFNLLKPYFNSRPLIITGSVLLAAIYIYELAGHGIYKRNNLTNIALAVVFIFYSLYYFYHLLKDEAYINLKFYPAFWWVAGVLLYYFGSTATDVFFPLLAKNVNLPNNAFIYIYWGFNFLLYSCWGYSFICKTWQTPASLTLS